MASRGKLKADFYRVEFHNTTWEVPKRYKELRAIGIGAFGSVCCALDTRKDIRVAIKKLSRPFQTQTHAKRAYRELQLLRHMNHENIIRLLDVFCPTEDLADFRDVYLVTELMGSDLHRIINSQPLTDEHVQFFVYQILRGLKYVHSAGIIHRDLKPSNIGVSEDSEIKILDFGLGRQIGDQMTGYVMTRYWRAPEVMLNWMHYGQKADIWSVGCVMAELLTGQTLFPGNDYRDHLNRILQICGTPDPEFMAKIESVSARQYVESLPHFPKKDFKEFFIGANPVAIDLITELLQLDPDRRPSAETLLRHPYLAKYHFPNDEPTSDRKYDSSFEELEKDIDGWRQAGVTHTLGVVSKLKVDVKHNFLAKLSYAEKCVFDDISNFVPPPIPQPTTHPTLSRYDTSQLSQSDSMSTGSPACSSRNSDHNPLPVD